MLGQRKICVELSRKWRAIKYCFTAIWLSLVADLFLQQAVELAPIKY